MQLRRTTYIFDVLPYVQVDIHLYFGRTSTQRTNRRKNEKSAGLEKLYFQERR
jgi:hypothetical protein